MKPLTLAACVTIIAALVIGVCGCTTSTSNQTPSVTASPLPHDPLLEKMVNATKQRFFGNFGNSVQAWDVTWNNGTNVTILDTRTYNVTIGNATIGSTSVASNETMLSFPTTQDATNFLNAFDKSSHGLENDTNYANGPMGLYLNVTGHAPSVYKYYYNGDGISPNNWSSWSLTQMDNIIQIETVITSSTFGL